MSIDERQLRIVVQAAARWAGGHVGTYIPMAEVVTASGLTIAEAGVVLEEFAFRKWTYVRGSRMALAKPALQQAIDWANAQTVLRAILNSAGAVGKLAKREVVVAASRLPHDELDLLVTELSVVGLAAHCLDDDGNAGLYLTRMGWDSLVAMEGAEGRG